MRLTHPRAAGVAALLAALFATIPALSAPAQAGAAGPATHAQRTPATLPAGAVNACPPSTGPGVMTCPMITTAGSVPGSQSRARKAAIALASTPAGLAPADLQTTYHLQSSTGGMRQTIAFIGAGADPTAAADLAVYRSQYSLTPCTTGDGCLTLENQNGGSTLPTVVENGWAANDALGLDIISAICPNCHILLVEANSNAISDLAVAANTAATTSGVHFVDNAYSGPEINTETSFDADYNHPGVAMIASAGDSGTGYSGNINYPAASPDVVSVGGTVLTQSGSTWTDTSAWSGTVSGCSLYETAKPSWQTDTGCAGRTDNDLSAAAATETSGVVNPLAIAYYNTSNGGTGWAEGGGTAASADIVTGAYALAGTPASNNPAAYPYENPGGNYTTPGNAYPYFAGLTDVTTGSTGTCSIAYLCTAAAGYDAPTGLGVPNGVQSLTSAGHTTGPIYAGFTLCLDNRGSNLANNNPIQSFKCNGGTNSQQWTLESDGTIRIGSGSSFCIGVSGGGTADNTPVILNTCDGATSQQWQPQANNWFRNQKSGKCLDDPSGSGGGVQLVIFGCGANNDRGEWWTYIEPQPTSSGEIKYRSDSSLCIDTPSLSANTNIEILRCTGNTNSQIWSIASSGQLKIASSWCISNALASTSELEKCNNNFAPQVIVITSNGALRNLWNVLGCDTKTGSDLGDIGGDCNATANEFLLP